MSQVLVCQGAQVAVAGLYPLIFPPNGYRGQLRWIGESAAVLGPSAYSLLLASSREGPLVLPKYVTVLLSDGQRVHIGDNLTLPSSERLARMPNLSVKAAESNIFISHPDAESEACQAGRDLGKKVQQVDVEDEEGEDGEEEEGEERTEEKLSVAVQEKKEEEEKSEECRRQLKVEMSQPGATEQELATYFSKFGDVKSVNSCSSLSATITFARPEAVELLGGLEHQLVVENDANGGGFVRLKMRGGDGRSATPPRHLRQNVNPFRCGFDDKEHLYLSLDTNIAYHFSGTPTIWMVNLCITSYAGHLSSFSSIAQLHLVLHRPVQHCHMKLESLPGDSSIFPLMLGQSLIMSLQAGPLCLILCSSISFGCEV